MPVPDTRPRCLGYGLARRCNAIVHPGYRRCPSCDRVYTTQQLRDALKHEQWASFRGLWGPEYQPAPDPPLAVAGYIVRVFPPAGWVDADYERALAALPVAAVEEAFKAFLAERLAQAGIVGCRLEFKLEGDSP